MSVDTANSRFHLEQSKPEAKITGVHESLLQECEKDIIWYRDNFFGKTHTNLIASESPAGPLAISVIKNGNAYKILVRSAKGSDRLVLQYPTVQFSIFRKIFAMGPSTRDVLAATSLMLPSFPSSAAAEPLALPVLSLKKCHDPSLPNELLAMEERQVIRSYKFGLCYLAEGQSTEEEMFQNILGERIELKGWKGYRAGLDVNENQTGTHSYYTKWQSYEIMFHVAPLLPYNANDKQQLERKRHIGNDIVVVIFQDSNLPFKMSSVSSKQNHVFVFVKPQGDGYQMSIVTKDGVPPFKPDLPQPAILDKSAVSRDYFLHKLVNGERASYTAPDFAPKIARTRSVLLNDVAQRFLKN